MVSVSLYSRRCLPLLLHCMSSPSPGTLGFSGFDSKQNRATLCVLATIITLPCRDGTTSAWTHHSRLPSFCLRPTSPYSGMKRQVGDGNGASSTTERFRGRRPECPCWLLRLVLSVKLEAVAMSAKASRLNHESAGPGKVAVGRRSRFPPS